MRYRNTDSSVIFSPLFLSAVSLVFLGVTGSALDGQGSGKNPETVENRPTREEQYKYEPDEETGDEIKHQTPVTGSVVGEHLPGNRHMQKQRERLEEAMRKEVQLSHTDVVSDILKGEFPMAGMPPTYRTEKVPEKKGKLAGEKGSGRLLTRGDENKQSRPDRGREQGEDPFSLDLDLFRVPRDPDRGRGRGTDRFRWLEDRFPKLFDQENKGEDGKKESDTKNGSREPSFTFPRPRCGPDITSTLVKLLEALHEKWNSMGQSKRESACDAVMNPGPGGRNKPALGFIDAWDIDNLHPEGRDFLILYDDCPRSTISQDCDETVEVLGQCYKAGEVNYTLWGQIGQKCDWTLQTTKVFVQAYKEGFYNLPAQAMGAVKKGWDYVTLGDGLSDAEERRQNEKERELEKTKNAALEWTKAGYLGLLYEPKKYDRNCPTTCPYSYPYKFTLYWDTIGEIHGAKPEEASPGKKLGTSSGEEKEK